jgi:hypothetical protein
MFRGSATEDSSLLETAPARAVRAFLRAGLLRSTNRSSRTLYIDKLTTTARLRTSCFRLRPKGATAGELGAASVAVGFCISESADALTQISI